MSESVKRPITDAEVDEICEMIKRAARRMATRDHIHRKREAERAQLDRIMTWKAWEFRHRRK